MKLILILFAALLLAVLLTGFFGCMWLEREIRRHAVRHDESFAELARRSMTVSAQIAETRKELQALAENTARARAEDAKTNEKFQKFLAYALDNLATRGDHAETLKRLDELKRGGAEGDAEKFEAFQAELWKRLDRLEGGAADGTAEFEEGVRNLLAYTAGKVPGVEVHL